MAAIQKYYCLLLVAASLWVLPVYSWGSLAHRAVAYVAEKYLTESAASFTANLLENEDISEAALWADELKFAHCRGWQYTREWHYIDANDNPPQQCGVQYDRDCVPEKGCVVSAIVNQTSRVNDQSLSLAQQQFALRFLLHFIGDIHQPLHTEAEDRGGNSIEVEFDDRKDNLHAVWDTAIPEKHAGHDDEVADAKAWAEQLFSGDNTELLAAECDDLNQAERCALLWAGEANQQVCKYVLKDDVEGVQGVDLGGDYYNGAVPIVDDLILKAGRRLGAWINALAEQSNALGRLVDQSSRHELLKRGKKHEKKPKFECPPYDA